MLRLFIHPAFVCLISGVLSAGALAENHYTRIEEILGRVYQNNPTLQAARAEFEGTQELYPQARAGWLPTVSAETSIFATDVESSNFGSGDGATTKDMTLSLDQPVFRGGRTFAETARARDLIRAGKATLRDVEQDILLRTVRAYMDVICDRELLTLRQDNEEVLNKELQAAKDRRELGTVTETDVRQAEARLSGAKSETIQAQTDLEISEAEFEELAGLPAPDHLMIPYKDFPFPDTLNETIKLAEKQNPAVRNAEFEHHAAKHNADATVRELFPQVSAFASHNRQYDPQPGIVSESETQTIGLRASLPLYQGGATRSRIREARSAAKKRDIEIREAKRRIRQDVTRNWKSYRAALAEMENRKTEIEAVERALKGVREEAKAGQRTVLDILDADQEVIDAKVLLARARREEISAKFALAASLGFLVPRKGEPNE